MGALLPRHETAPASPARGRLWTGELRSPSAATPAPSPRRCGPAAPAPAGRATRVAADHLTNQRDGQARPVFAYASGRDGCTATRALSTRSSRSPPRRSSTRRPARDRPRSASSAASTCATRTRHPSRASRRRRRRARAHRAQRLGLDGLRGPDDGLLLVQGRCRRRRASTAPTRPSRAPRRCGRSGAPRASSARASREPRVPATDGRRGEHPASSASSSAIRATATALPASPRRPPSTYHPELRTTMTRHEPATRGRLHPRRSRSSSWPSCSARAGVVRVRRQRAAAREGAARCARPR